MIYTVSCKKRVEKLEVEGYKQRGVSFDYSKVIVKKPWGYEYLVFENDFIAIWMLHIVRKRKTSMHCHHLKKTGLILLSGKAILNHSGGTIDLDTLDGVMIERGAFHSTEVFNPLPMEPQSENGVWVMEIESPPLKTDLVRAKDAYGREGASYEGPEQMIQEPAERLEFEDTSSKKIISKKFLDCVFTVRNGAFDQNLPDSDALVSVIARGENAASDNPYLKISELHSFKDFFDKTRDENLEEYVLLVIEKEKKMVKVSDYIFSSIAELGVKNVFVVSGGAAMHLVDSLGRNKQLEYVTTHHEQSAAMAAEGYARISGKPGVALTTSGPGGTNAITGVCGAWIDSIPTIFISGQITTNTLLRGTGLRQFGIQESDISELVKPVTKYAATVTDPDTIKYHIQKAIHLATTGRPGPVWLDIPLDVQSKQINPEELDSYTPNDADETIENKLEAKVAKVIKLLRNSERPVFIAGYGVRLSKGEKEFIELAEKLQIPVISSWTASDLIPTLHELSIGRSGIMGDRAGNFTVQNADLILIVGSRMSIPQVGYNYADFAREAKKIMVDIDKKELEKKSLKLDVEINADAKKFMTELLCCLKKENIVINVEPWLKRCQQWKAKYPVALPEYSGNKDAVNSFYFIDILSKKLDQKAVVVTDMGTSFTCTMQTFKTKSGQRLFTSSGHASMGFGLPGAIGACYGNNKKKTICISGDGGLQMNIQELQTLIQHNLPIILFVLNNKGYLTIKLMQQNHFGRYTASENSSGVSCPDIVKVAQAYGIKADRIANHKELHDKIDDVLAKPGPFVCEIIMSENQPLIPRVSSVKKPDGSIVSKSLEDLYPFLPRKEFLENMIVKPSEALK